MLRGGDGALRVLIDARVLSEPALAERGVGRYTSCLLAALVAEGDLDIVELRDPRRPPAPARLAEGWDHVLMARDARHADADVVHSPSIDGASIRTGVPLVVTLHDLAPLKDPSHYLRTGLKHRLRYRAVQRATRVIVPSQAVADDALALLAVAAVVVPEAPAPAFRRVEAPLPPGLPERFLLWVGGLDPPDPRKGLGPLVELVAAGDGLPLVLAGRTDAAGRALERPGRVFLAGRLSDPDLAALYSAAEAFVFPSMDEGYGLPPVEALACGTPVAAYAAGALPETLIGATGVELVPPGAAAALLEAAETLAGSEASPPPRTWRDVARETHAVYVQAAARRRS